MNTMPIESNNMRQRVRGFTIAELLVVLAIIGIAVAVSIPLANEQIRLAKVRSAADQLAMDIKAARMIAVSTRSAGLDLVVMPQPDNYYEYTDNKGKLRHIDMPTGVRITSSDSPLTFRLNGSLDAAATTIMEIDVTVGVIERWTISTNILGVSTTERVRVAS